MMFQDAVGAGLEYAFLTPIQSIVQESLRDKPVTVQTSRGENFQARRIINPIPLNVLKDIAFQPPLSRRRQEAINTGHVNQMSKIYADVDNKELKR
ncbi:Fc.00g054790.m01.CDS01 [Cosmosporella sp. VM-42]